MVDREGAVSGRVSRVSRAPVAVVLIGMALAATLVVVGALIAASPAPAPDISKPGTQDAPRPVNVILRDYRFDPTPLYLVPGETVRFNVVNGGLVEHEFVLGDGDFQRAWSEAQASVTPPAAFATRPPVDVPGLTGGLRLLLGSGESATATYEVPNGTMPQIFCHLPGHVEQGMVGQVVGVSDEP